MFRPINDSILIRFDKESDKVNSGLLYKPEGAAEHIFGTGEVLAVGPGKWNNKGGRYEPMLVQVGDGVAVIKFLSKTETGKYVQYALGDDQLVIKPSDVLFTFDRKDPPELS
jgi:chaperonin GroES